jgi:hypothetical protein
MYLDRQLVQASEQRRKVRDKREHTPERPIAVERLRRTHAGMLYGEHRCGSIVCVWKKARFVNVWNCGRNLTNRRQCTADETVFMRRRPSLIVS